jgi:hypothetical protein
MHDSFGLISHLFGRPGYVRYPLDFPKPDADFFGYNDRVIRLENGTKLLSTKNIIRASGWAATALIAWKAGQYVTGKTECLELYRRYIGDEWTAHLEELHNKVRDAWKYLIPAAQAAQAELRTICRRNLAFENHFLLMYKDYLLSELATKDPSGCIWALDSYGRTPYLDEEVCSAIASLQRHEDLQIQQRAAAALKRIEELK